MTRISGHTDTDCVSNRGTFWRLYPIIVSDVTTKTVTELTTRLSVSLNSRTNDQQLKQFLVYRRQNAPLAQTATFVDILRQLAPLNPGWFCSEPMAPTNNGVRIKLGLSILVMFRIVETQVYFAHFCLQLETICMYTKLTSGNSL